MRVCGGLKACALLSGSNNDCLTFLPRTLFFIYLTEIVCSYRPIVPFSYHAE